MNPRSGRNLYFAGLGAFLEGDFPRAQAFYKQVRPSVYPILGLLSFLSLPHRRHLNQPTIYHYFGTARQAQEMLPAEMKRDTSGQYAYLEQECQRGLALVQERLAGTEQALQAQAKGKGRDGDMEGAVLLETGEGSFGGFVGWRRLVPGWVGGGGGGNSRRGGGSLA